MQSIYHDALVEVLSNDLDETNDLSDDAKKAIVSAIAHAVYILKDEAKREVEAMLSEFKRF